MAVQIETSAGEGGALPVMIGEAIGSGRLLLNKTDTPRALLMGLGRGPWSEAVQIYYRGDVLPAASWRFHPGTISSGFSDPVQGAPQFFPGGIPYSGMAYLEAQIPGEDDPEPAELIGRYKTQILPDYDEAGNELGAGYSSNPARAVAWHILKQARLPSSRIDWPSWRAWRDFCDDLIPWDNGTEVKNIKRFEAHLIFRGAVRLPDLINLYTDLSATEWQDDGERLLFFHPIPRASIYTFDASTIVDSSLQITTVDLRLAPTRVIVNFRDLASEFLAPASTEEKLSASIIDQRGIIDHPPLEFGAMHYSQAQRIGLWHLRKLSSFPVRAEFTARADSFPVLPGDPVTISHQALGGSFPAAVLEATDETDGTDARRFNLAVQTDVLYRDTDHRPIPKATVV